MKYENFYIKNEEALESWINYIRYNIKEELKESYVILNLEVKKHE